MTDPTPQRGQTSPDSNRGSFAPSVAPETGDTTVLGHPSDPVTDDESTFESYGLDREPWAQAGFKSATVADRWSSYDWDESEADRAAQWRAYGHGPGMAREWEDDGFEPDAADEWIAHGVTDARNAAHWDDNQFTPTEAGRLQSLGLGAGHAVLLDTIRNGNKRR